MLRTPLFLLALTATTAMHAQSKNAVGTLTGSGSQRWSVIGTNTTPGAACKAGEATYTF